MAEVSFKPYEGSEPYIFISYAHADAEKVIPIITDMHERGYRIWYDEGIDVGSEWTECIASHLAGTELMLGFVTPKYMESPNCRREMNYAVQKKKHIINIFLEQTELSPGMELQIGGIWALMKYTFPSDEYFYRKLYEAPALKLISGEAPITLAAPPSVTAVERDTVSGKGKKKPKEKPVKVIDAELPDEKKRKKKKLVRTIVWSFVGLLLIAAAILGYIGARTGLIQRIWNRTVGGTGVVEVLPAETVAEFKSPVVEAAARDYCGKETGDITVSDLMGLDMLYIIGDSYSFGAPESPEPLSAVAATDKEYALKDGTVIERGGVTDLSDFKYFPSLTYLGLEFQSLTSLETMPAAPIETLTLRACRLSSLKGVASLPELTGLDVSFNPLTDIGALSGCLKLTSLTVLRTTVSDYSALKSLPAISVLSASDATLSALKPALMPNTLSSVTLTDCDLRGQLFDILDSPKLMYLSLTRCTLDAATVPDEGSGLVEITLTDCEGDLSGIQGITGVKVTIR